MITPFSVFAKETKKQQAITIPNHVLSISKENTYPNAAADQEIVEPSKETKALLETSQVPLENPDLIRMLNETTIKPSPVAIGYRATIYLGHWALHYKSADTTVNWKYKKINTNEFGNYDGEAEKKMHYLQKTEVAVTGALTNRIKHPDDIKKMMLLQAKQKSKLPLSSQAVFGSGTKTEHAFAIPPKKQGLLNAYAAAVNEKGEATFGEVYLVLKGSKKQLMIKNVTKQGIGGWIPIQDYISFSLQVK